MNNPSNSWRLSIAPLSDLSWWHWVITIGLLIASFAGVGWAIHAAIGLCAVMTLLYLAALRSVRPFPVQIRLGFLALLLIGLLPAMRWMHVSQLCGVSAMVLVGYCPMARMLMLMPWNRQVALTWDYARRAMLHRPGPGGLIEAPQVVGAFHTQVEMTCRLADRQSGLTHDGVAVHPPAGVMQPIR